MKKHAYLILAHNEFHMLKRLIRELDNEKNDIYIHIDKKTKYVDEEEISSWTEHSGVFFIPRRKIYWGTLSIVKTEISLLEAAVKREYQYYHLLSGVDFPLKNQDVIHEFFEDKNCEYLRFYKDGDNDEYFLYKVKHYFPFLKYVGRGEYQGSGKKTEFLRWLHSRQWMLDVYQEKKGTDRTRKYKEITFYKGDQWFSITHEFAKFIISQKKKITKMFWMTNGPDEFVMQTLAMNSRFSNRVQNRALREIDWLRGSPYEYSENDLEELMNSKEFFARKISYDNQPALVNSIVYELHTSTGIENKPLISVIIPCCNVQKYLADCVESIICQSYKNIEILLIDFGSTDGTVELAKSYADRYSNVYYHSSDMAGISAAKNKGIGLSKGEYLAFVDSLDWVDERFVEMLFCSMVRKGADIAVCGYQKDKCDDVVFFNEEKVISSHTAMKILVDFNSGEKTMLVDYCNKLYKKELFENIRYPEGRINEDEFAVHRIIGAADSIVMIPHKLYHCRIREDGTTSLKVDHNLKYMEDLDACIDRIAYVKSMMYGDLLSFMLQAFLDGIKKLMVAYSSNTVNGSALIKGIRSRVLKVYMRYFFQMDSYQRRDSLKIVINTEKYRQTVIERAKI
jgi:glycosyltransferase involved in cell wall biosynthesis